MTITGPHTMRTMIHRANPELSFCSSGHSVGNTLVMLTLVVLAEPLITTVRSPNDIFQSVGSAYAPCDFEVNSVIENEASLTEVTYFHLYKKFVVCFLEHFG